MIDASTYTIIFYLGGGLIFAFVVRTYLNYRVQIAKYNKAAETSKTAAGTSMFDFVDYALGEINAAAKEMTALGVKKEQLAPLEKRYNQLLWLKQNKGLALPIIEGGTKMIENFLGGLLK